MRLNWLLCAILLLGAALRFYGLGEQCYFHDEIFELHVARRSIPYIIEAVNIHPVHSPLNQFISHYFLFLGQNEFVLRLPAAIWGVLGVWVIYLAGSAFFNRRVGLFSAFLLAISSYHIRYSQEARMYALLVLGALLSQYFFWKGLQGENKKNWIGYIIATTLALYTHLFAVFIVASQGIFICVRALLNRYSKVKFARSGLFWLSLVIIGLLFIPRLIPVAKNTFSQESFLAINVSPPPIARGWSPRGVMLTDLTTNLILFSGGTGAIFYIYLAFFVIGIEGNLKRYGPATAYLFLTAVLPFASFYLIKPSRIFAVRYLIFLLPVYYILIAAGVNRLELVFTALYKKLSKKVKYLPVAFYFLAVLIFLLAGLRPLKKYYRHWSYPIGNRLKYDWRRLDSFLKDHARPGDILIPRGGIWYYHLVYLRQYLDHGLLGRLAVKDPTRLTEAGIWWVGGDPGKRPYPPGFKPVKIDADIPDLPVSYGRGPVSFTEETFPGLCKIPGNDAVGITGTIKVKPGRIFWVSVRVRGIERHYARYSPFPGIFFYGEAGRKEPNSSNKTGIRLIADEEDGWKRIILNGITPAHASTAQVIIQKDKQHIGEEVEVKDLKFYGDWGE